MQGRDLASLTAAHLPTRSLCPGGVTAAPGCHIPQQQPLQQSWQQSRAQGFTAGFTENTQGCSRNSRMTRDDDQSTASSALKDSSRKSAELSDEGDYLFRTLTNKAQPNRWTLQPALMQLFLGDEKAAFRDLKGFTWQMLGTNGSAFTRVRSCWKLGTVGSCYIQFCWNQDCNTCRSTTEHTAVRSSTATCAVCPDSLCRKAVFV